MKEPEIDEIKKLLKASLRPAPGVELERDLWPKMLARLEQGAVSVPWWDWALLAAVSTFLCFFPSALPALLYHL